MAAPENYPIGVRQLKEREVVGCDRRDEQIPVQKSVPHSQLVSAIRGIDVDRGLLAACCTCRRPTVVILMCATSIVRWPATTRPQANSAAAPRAAGVARR